MEFAIVAPLMFMLMLATFEFGRAFMVVHILTESARFGCRGGYLNGTYYTGGIVEGTTTQTVTQTVQAYLTAGPYGIRGDSVQVNFQIQNPNIDQKVVTVTVTVPVSDITWVPIPWFTNGNGWGTTATSNRSLTGQFSLHQE